jgi:hypothetical protein
MDTALRSADGIRVLAQCGDVKYRTTHMAMHLPLDDNPLHDPETSLPARMLAEPRRYKEACCFEKPCCRSLRLVNSQEHGLMCICVGFCRFQFVMFVKNMESGQLPCPAADFHFLCVHYSCSVDWEQKVWVLEMMFRNYNFLDVPFETCFQPILGIYYNGRVVLSVALRARIRFLCVNGSSEPAVALRHTPVSKIVSQDPSLPGSRYEVICHPQPAPSSPLVKTPAHSMLTAVALSDSITKMCTLTCPPGPCHPSESFESREPCEPREPSVCHAPSVLPRPAMEEERAPKRFKGC